MSEVPLYGRPSGSYEKPFRCQTVCPECVQHVASQTRKVDMRLPKNKNQIPIAQGRSTQFISMIKLIWTSRLSMKNSLSRPRPGVCFGVARPRRGVPLASQGQNPALTDLCVPHSFSSEITSHNEFLKSFCKVNSYTKPST